MDAVNDSTKASVASVNLPSQSLSFWFANVMSRLGARPL